MKRPSYTYRGPSLNKLLARLSKGEINDVTLALVPKTTSIPTLREAAWYLEVFQGLTWAGEIDLAQISEKPIELVKKLLVKEHDLHLLAWALAKIVPACSDSEVKFELVRIWCASQALASFFKKCAATVSDYYGIPPMVVLRADSQTIQKVEGWSAERLVHEMCERARFGPSIILKE